MQEDNTMATILPVSDLRNYNTVLEHVSEGKPVYLTVNGRGRYIIRDIAEDLEYEKVKAILKLLSELVDGRKSGEEKGYVTADDILTFLKEKKEK